MKNDFSSISEILNEKVFDFKKGQNALKMSTIFSFWGDVVGKKFQKCSKPYCVKGNKLFVTCENSFVLQELLMFKSTILSKIKPFSSPLGIEIKDIVFDYKNWKIQNEEIVIDDEFKKFYTEDEINSVKIDEKTYAEAFSAIDDLKFLDDNQKKNFKAQIIRAKKAEILRKNGL